MPSVIVWDDILLHPEEYVDRHFSLLKGISGGIYRGPIVKIEEGEKFKQRYIFFELAWCAYFEADGTWRRNEGTRPLLPKDGVSLSRMEDGQINIMPRTAPLRGIIHPRGDILSIQDVVGFGRIN